MMRFEKSIDVKVPVRAAYDQWTQFEEFPRFMMNVCSVRQLDPSHLRWEAEIAGKHVAWTAEITRQEPDRVVAWRSTSGVHNAGQVSFTPLTAETSRVTLAMEFEPEGALETAGSAIGLVERRVEHDLEKFKCFIEETGHPTGAWRGRIESGEESGESQESSGAS